MVAANCDRLPAVVAMPVIAPVDPLTDKTPVFAIVTAADPLNDVPDKPVPIVSALVVVPPPLLKRLLPTPDDAADKSI